MREGTVGCLVPIRRQKWLYIIADARAAVQRHHAAVVLHSKLWSSAKAMKIRAKVVKHVAYVALILDCS